jgi:hypothetical protein
MEPRAYSLFGLGLPIGSRGQWSLGQDGERVELADRGLLAHGRLGAWAFAVLARFHANCQWAEALRAPQCVAEGHAVGHCSLPTIVDVQGSFYVSSSVC